MRTSKKKSKAPTAADRDFERLYRTIPNKGMGATDASLEEMDPVGPKPQKPKWKRILKRVAIGILIILIISGGWLGWKFFANSIKLFGWKGFTDVFKNVKLDGEDQGRVNILLAGNSADDPGHNGAQLTDSIMLVSINTKDPTNKSAYIMSIPRDMYVEIPGSGYAKINEAYQDGEQSKFSEAGYPAGGMGLLEKTVSERFGVKIHYYALVNYTALEQAVNAVGGVQVTIQSSDPRGLYDPSPNLRNNRQPLVKLPNGTVTLDGIQALGLARARGDHRGSYGYGLGDFTRTENQRKILVGIKDKATSLGTLSNPVKLGELMDSFGNNVKTDFNAGEVRRLNTLMKDIPSNRIVSVSLNNANGKNLLANYRTKSGQSALVPAAGVDNYSDIKAFISGL